MILERMGHPPDSYDVCDHENRVKLDNRRSNLRPATFKLNAENRDQTRITGRPRTLPDAEPRPCALCEVTFTPRRKSPKQKFCSKKCQRRAMLKYDDSDEQRRRSNLRWERERSVAGDAT